MKNFKKIIFIVLIILFVLIDIGTFGILLENKKNITNSIITIIICTGIIILLIHQYKNIDEKELNKKYRHLAEILEEQYKLSEKEYIERENDLKEKYLEKETFLEVEYKEKQKLLEEEYKTKNDNLFSEYNTLKKDINKLELDIDTAKKELSSLNNEISEKECENILKLINFNEYDDITSSEIKNKISLNNTKIKELISSNKAISMSSDITKKEFRLQSKQLLKSFNTETNYLIDKVNANNFDNYRNKITKCYEELNKLYEIDNVKLTMEFLELKLEELNLVYQYNVKKEIEKEQQRAIKEQMLEEEKVRREIEKEKKKIEKEENQFNNELKKIMEYMTKTNNDIEKQFYINKINELEEKINLLKVDKENVLNRELNTRAGFVYIISNIGSFGENVYKIGMTRRLEPMDRVRELSSASVPFSFDVHAMIFSDDAPTLENSIHNKFRKYAVNKVNERKEFFKIPLSEIKNFVNNEFGLTVEFTEIAKAEEYYQSVKIENKNLIK